jgi:hypothetical protein
MAHGTFGPKGEQVAEGWRGINNEELHNLYASPNIRVVKSRRMIWAGHVARMGRMRNAYSILAGRPEEKRPHGRLRRRLEYNIRMDLREIGWEVVDWIHLAQYMDQWWALVNRIMNLRVQ